MVTGQPSRAALRSGSPFEGGATWFATLTPSPDPWHRPPLRGDLSRFFLGRRRGQGEEVFLDLAFVDVLLDLNSNELVVSKIKPHRLLLIKSDCSCRLSQDIGANKAEMETVSRDVLPAYLSGGTCTPVFYYLAGAGRLNEDGKLANPAGLDDRVNFRASKGYKSLRPTPNPPAKMRATIEAHESFESLAEAEDRSVGLQALQYMQLTKVDETHLRQYLLDKYEETAPNKPTTVWAKAVCIYDALAFGPLKP